MLQFATENPDNANEDRNSPELKFDIQQATYSHLKLISPSAAYMRR